MMAELAANMTISNLSEIAVVAPMTSFFSVCGFHYRNVYSALLMNHPFIR